MEVVEYFASESQEHWKKQISAADWKAAEFLIDLLNHTEKFDELLGPGGKLFLLVEGDRIISFATLTHQDCIRDLNMFPWVGFLYTYPDYRGRRYSEVLLRHVEEKARAANYGRVYLGTDHVGLYEKYGYSYMETRKDYRGGKTRIYYKEV